MQQYHIAIPCKPHISKYTHIRYGKPVNLSANSTLSTLIKAFVHSGNRYHSKYNGPKLDRRFELLTAQFDISILYADLVNNRIFNITPHHIISINQFLENEFKERLYIHCQRFGNWQKRYIGIDKSIETFADFYGIVIDQDITFDNLKKMEYRYRQNALKKISPTLSAHQNNNHFDLLHLV